MESVISLKSGTIIRQQGGHLCPGMAHNDIMTFQLGFGDSSTGCGAIPGIKFPL